MFSRVVALGDSFVEGLGDPGPGEHPRGWVDRMVEGMQAVSPETTDIAYANLAIRGRRFVQIVEEQVHVALDMQPDLIVFNGGGNDLLRVGASIPRLDALTRLVARAITGAGVHLMLCTGADPSDNLPFGERLRTSGMALTLATRRWADAMEGVTMVDNFTDTAFHDPRLWAPDGMHLNSRGHHLAASNGLKAFGHDTRALAVDWDDDLDHHVPSREYYTEHVLPWVTRRLRGRSSGDGRSPKRPELATV